jgi:predicted ferric reductase
MLPAKRSSPNRRQPGTTRRTKLGNTRYLRLTVKAVGDHSAALARVRPGTAIAIEGPYGAFTRHAQRRPQALLVAAGIGVTALRSLLEDLPPRSAPVVILRATRETDSCFAQRSATSSRTAAARSMS